MVKITLFEFSRNMMQQLGGEFHVDLRHDRSRSVDRMEPAAAGVRKESAGKLHDVGKGNVRRLDQVTPNELDAEAAFFKSRDVLCNCKRVCRGANSGVKCRELRILEPYRS